MTTATPTPYQPLAPDALPQERIAHALQWGIGNLDGAGLRALDSIALAAVRGLPQELSPTDRIVDDRMHDLRLRIAQEQARRAQAWARIASQLAGMETDPDTDHDVPDQEQDQETDQDRALKLLRAALLLIMGPQQPGNGGGGGRPVRPMPPGPRTPPNDGRALSMPGAPVSSRRGDDDDIPF